MTADTLELGAFTVDLTQFTVWGPRGNASITPLEAKFLTVLAEHAGRPVGNGDLLRRVWGYSPEIQTRAVSLLVSRLRRKMEIDPAKPVSLRTVQGVGYQLCLTERSAYSPPTLGDLSAQLAGSDAAAHAEALRAARPSLEEQASGFGDAAAKAACALVALAVTSDAQVDSSRVWELMDAGGLAELQQAECQLATTPWRGTGCPGRCTAPPRAGTPG